MIGIITALDQEQAAVLTKLNQVTTKKLQQLTFYQGYLAQIPVVLVKSGVGKVLASIVTTIMLENFPIKLLVNLGVAGGLTANLNIGDIIIGERVAQADFDLRVFGYPQSFNEPRLSYQLEPTITAGLKASFATNKQVIFGDLVSSDQFISRKDQVIQLKKNFPSALAADMEAAAIAMAAKFYQLDCLIIRSISDLAGSPQNEITFSQFVSSASLKAADLLVEISQVLVNLL